MSDWADRPRRPVLEEGREDGEVAPALTRRITSSRRSSRQGDRAARPPRAGEPSKATQPWTAPQGTFPSSPTRQPGRYPPGDQTAGQAARRPAQTFAQRPDKRPDSPPPAPPLADAEGHDLRPDPLTASTPAELMQALRQFRVWAGQPGYRVMSRRTGYRAAASTLCTALKSDKMPKLEMVQAIIEGCGGSKDDQRLYSTAWRQITLAQAGR
jgi:hypothetical protein